DVYGAKGDGSTDDTNAIQGALNDCRTGGGGIVGFPFGTYMLSMANRTGGPGPSFPWSTALMYGPKTILAGGSRDATTLKLLNNQSGTVGFSNNNAAVISPWDVNQEQSTFTDFTIDGNAAGQAAGEYHNGLFIPRQRGVKCHRVRIKDCKGAQTPVAANTVFFYANGSSDTSFIDCDAIQTGTTECSAGFSAVSCTNVHYVSCRAGNIGNASPDHGGFAYIAFQTRQAMYAACHGYLCGQETFHVDDASCETITYVGCVAGGQASSLVSGQQYPFTQ